MGRRGLGLGWLPLFTMIWFYILFIPVYSYVYKWYGVGTRLMVFTLSSSAMKEAPGSISVFGGYMGAIAVLFFVNKMIWLQIVKSKPNGYKIKPVLEYFFLICILLSGLFMWLFTSFFYGGFPILHNTSATLFFGFELLSLFVVGIVDYLNKEPYKICNIIRVVIIITALIAFMALLFGNIVDTANDGRVEREKRTTYDTSNNHIYDNILGTAEIILILVGLLYYGTFIPMFSDHTFIVKQKNTYKNNENEEKCIKTSIEKEKSFDVQEEVKY